MKKIFCSLLITGLLLVLSGFGLSGSVIAKEQTAAEFYADKTVTIVAPNPPGGGTDYAARVVVEFWKTFTGGHMIVKNMPGADGLLGVNYVYTSKPDGLTLGLSEAAQTTPAVIFNLPGVQYNLSEMNWFGMIAPVPYAFVISSKLPAKSMQEVQQMDGFRMGTSTQTGTDTLAMALIAEAFKLKNAKIISGFTGTAEVGLAIARGELEGTAYHPVPIIDWTEKGYVKSPPLVAVWPERVYIWPNTPTITEMVKLTPEQENIFKLYLALKSCKLIFGPPGMPKDRVDFVQQTVDKMLSDEACLNQMKKVFKVWLKPMSGKEVTQEMKNLKVISKGDVDAVQALLKTKYHLGK